MCPESWLWPSHSQMNVHVIFTTALELGSDRLGEGSAFFPEASNMTLVVWWFGFHLESLSHMISKTLEISTTKKIIIVISCDNVIKQKLLNSNKRCGSHLSPLVVLLGSGFLFFFKLHSTTDVYYKPGCVKYREGKKKRDLGLASALDVMWGLNRVWVSVCHGGDVAVSGWGLGL